VGFRTLKPTGPQIFGAGVELAGALTYIAEFGLRNKSAFHTSRMGDSNSLIERTFA